MVDAAPRSAPSPTPVSPTNGLESLSARMSPVVPSTAEAANPQPQVPAAKKAVQKPLVRRVVRRIIGPSLLQRRD